MMNETIKILKNHRSIRKFQSSLISKEMLNQILLSAQQASSSSFLQVVTIIRVTDAELRHQIMQLSGEQPYIDSAAEFFIFCVDYARHSQIVPDAKTGFVEQLLVGAVDVGIMAQNALIAAESLGLGGVYIGGIRNHPEEIGELLNLPRLTIPIVGMCLGYPDQNPEKKPRLPIDWVVFENSYEPLPQADIHDYDQVIADYYAHRTSNQKRQTWSEQIRSILTKEARPFMMSYLNRKGFNLK